MLRKWHILIYFLLLYLPFSVSAITLRIAVAANVQEPFEKIAAIFQKKTGIQVEHVIGPTGKFVAQITHGAPFDILLSADMAYPRKLHQMGLTYFAPKPYVNAKLILWTTRLFNLKNWPKLLQSNAIKHIAIANPDLAPLGKVAVQILKSSSLLDKVSHKFVYGDSIAQTNQYIATGHADLGFTAQSIVFTAAFAKKGQWIFIPQKFYPPVEQGVAVIKSTTHLAAAQQFVALLYSSDAQKIFKRYGYEPYRP